MKYNLTESEKDLLATIVARIRAQNLKKEFTVLWTVDGPKTDFAGKEGLASFPGLTEGEMGALEREGLLNVRRPDAPEKNPTLISVPQIGYDAVDSRFKEKKELDTNRVMMWIALAGLFISVLIYYLQK